MEFEVYAASYLGDEEKVTIEVNTLDDLKDLSDKNGEVRLIINFHTYPTIILYDDDVE